MNKDVVKKVEKTKMEIVLALYRYVLMERWAIHILNGADPDQERQAKHSNQL